MPDLMRPTLLLALSVFSAPVLADEGPVETPPAPAPDPSAKGALEGVAGAVAKLTQFRLVRGALRMDASNTNRLLTAWGLLEQAAGSSGSSGSNGDHWARDFNCETLRAEIRGANGQDRFGEDNEELGTFVRFELREVKEPHRTLVVSGTSGGLVKIEYREKGDLLLLDQGEDGRVRVLIARGDACESASAASFWELWKTHKDLLGERFFGALKPLGILPPVFPDSPEMKTAVLDRLRPVSEEELRQVEGWIATLDAQAFAEREAATLTLTGHAVRYRPLLEEALKAHADKPEVKGRLQGVLDSLATEQAKEAEAEVSQLVDDVDYLVGLLPECSGADRKALVELLERRTMRRLGDDPAAWKAWAAARK